MVIQPEIPAVSNGPKICSKGWWATNSREVFQGKTREAGQQLFRPPPILLKRVNRLIGSCLFAISYVLFCVELGLTFVFPQNFFSTQQCPNSFILHRVQFCECMFRKEALWRRGRKMPTKHKCSKVEKWKSSQSTPSTSMSAPSNGHLGAVGREDVAAQDMVTPAPRPQTTPALVHIVLQ